MKLLAKIKESKIILNVDVVEDSTKEEEDVKLTLIIIEVKRVTKKVIIIVINNSKEAKEVRINSFSKN